MNLAWELARGSLLKLVLFSLAFKVVNFILLAPLVSFTMRLFLQRWGRVSVGNFEIAHFLLSPIGLVAICCVGGIAIATLYLEIAGLMQIMLNPRFRWWSFNSNYLNLYQKLLKLGGIQLSVVLATALPFVGLVGLIYAVLWQGRDLNGLILLRPQTPRNFGHGRTHSPSCRCHSAIGNDASMPNLLTIVRVYSISENDRARDRDWLYRGGIAR